MWDKTLLHPMIFTDSELSLAFLREQKTSQTCTRIFNMLWTLAGPDLFLALFEHTLTDIIGNRALSGISDAA